MRGLGAFQRDQMKRGDPRVAELFVHIRRTVELMEEIALHPVKEESSPSPARATKVEAIPPSATERLAYSIKEVSKLMGISRNTIYALVNEGKLASLKIGHRTLIPAKALHEWVMDRSSL